MSSTATPVILQKQIDELDLSGLFKQRCMEMGFKTLQEVVDTSPELLVRKQGFNYIWLGELTAILKENNLLHLLQATGGNSRI